LRGYLDLVAGGSHHFPGFVVGVGGDGGVLELHVVYFDARGGSLGGGGDQGVDAEEEV